MKTASLAHLSTPEQIALNTFVSLIRSRYPQRILAVSLFGSKASGDDDPESDVDLIVIVDSEDNLFKSALWKIASEISLEYNILISVRIFSHKRWEKTRELRLPLYRGIVTNQILLTPERIPV